MGVFKNNNYNKKLKHFAQKLRNNQTRAEKHIWYNLLNKRKMLGYRFLRQRVIDKYIADFFSPELGLIIEIDGISHHFHEVQIRDIERAKKLEGMGYSLIRFSDDEVMNNLNGVSESITNWIEQNKKSPSTPLRGLRSRQGNTFLKMDIYII